jgi:hypothetical protein
LSLEPVQPVTERLVTWFSLAKFGVVRQRLELVPIGLVVVVLSRPCPEPLGQAVELVGLVQIRVGFLRPGEAPGALLEAFEDNSVERDGREDAAIERIGAIGAHYQQNASFGQVAADSEQNASFGQDESPFWSYQGTTTRNRHLDRPVPFHLISVFNSLVAHGFESFPEVAFGRIDTSVVAVLDAARPKVIMTSAVPCSPRPPRTSPGQTYRRSRPPYQRDPRDLGH